MKNFVNKYGRMIFCVALIIMGILGSNKKDASPLFISLVGVLLLVWEIRSTSRENSDKNKPDNTFNLTNSGRGRSYSSNYSGVSGISGTGGLSGGFGTSGTSNMSSGADNIAIGYEIRK